jgi:hypothetical protein
MGCARARQQGYRGKRNEIFVVRTNKTQVVSKELKSRNGPTASKKVYAVCQNCNNSWMSQLENKAKHVILPLMKGDLIDLDAQMQRTLIEWIVLKVLVADNHENRDAVFRKTHLVAFKATREIPAGMSIWVGRCVDESCKSFFRKHAALLGQPGKDPPKEGRKNTQSTAIGIGELFIFSMSCITESIDLNRFIQFDNHVVRLWPNGNDPLVWPPMRILTQQQVMKVASALDSLIAHPNVLWAGLA